MLDKANQASSLEFYLRSDTNNSTVLAGKKKIRTFEKKKKQKRVLRVTLKNLHVKFLA